MSLQVWLPLDGNLNNYGIAPIIATNNGATIDNNGKIGKCYSFDGSDDFIKLEGSCLTSIFAGTTHPFSVCMWIYNNETAANRAILFGNYTISPATSSNFFNIELTGSSNQIRYDWKANPDWTGGSTTTVPTGVWTHICCSYDGTNEYIYINGVLQATKAGSLSALGINSGAIYYLGRDARTGATAFLGKMNDFRIYNNCLSAAEVKKIAQSLILHWPLSGAPCSSQSYLHSRLPSEYQQLEYIEALNSAYLNTGYIADRSTTRIRIEMMPLDTADSAFFGNRGDYWCFYNIGGNYWYPRSACETKTGPNMAINYKILIDWNKGIFEAWQNLPQGLHYEYANRTGGSRDSDTMYLFNFHQIDNRKSYARLYFCEIWDNDVKVRDYIPAKRIADNVVGLYDIINNNFIVNAGPGSLAAGPIINFTPFTNFGTIEYDISGYNHIGNITVDSSSMVQTATSPRYGNHLYFNGSRDIRGIAGEMSSFDFSELTLCGWLKPHNAPSGWTGTCGIQADIGNGNGKSFGFSNYAGKFTAHLNNGSYDTAHQTTTFTIDQWYFCTLTLQGTILKMYLNAELINTYTINWGSTPVNANTLFACAVDLPGSDERLNGYMSDIRLYTTVLSTEDIQELYKMGHIST